MYNKIVIHYSEIGLKGRNRAFFEKKLIDNIKKSLGKDTKKVYKRYGRIICNITDKTNLEKIKQKLKKIPGIAYFSFATYSKLEIKDIKKQALEILKNEEFTTFKVITKRSNKKFQLNSFEINKALGQYLSNNLKKKVIMNNTDVNLYIEICEKEVFIYTNKHQSMGGLPVGVSGKVICSLSGGIDSPVASVLMMKRGCKVIFVHIFNKTLTKQGVLTKINKIVQQLTKFQFNSRLYVIPFEKIQKEIVANVPSKYRMIIYRRFMMKIINKLAKTKKAKGILTGDSIGQVASQTLENLRCIYQASDLPVFAPLIGMNKEEIVQIAKKTGTFEYSILPYPDCCSFMIAKHPETKANLKQIIQAENNIKNQEKLIQESISKAKIKIF